VTRLFITLSLFAAVLAAQETVDFQAKIRASMAASLAQQKVSVQRQAASSQPAAPDAPAAPAGFFTVPWPAPVNTNVALSSGADCDPLPKDQLDPLVSAASTKEGVKEDLIQAVIHKESAGKPCAVSPKGAQGLMQLMPETAEQLGVHDAFDAKQNIDAGTKLLKELLSKYNGDVALALGAYNAGAGAVDRAGGVPAIPETVNYVSDILKQVSKQ
jgi:soluble lytic murein transglycosylase-like protein